MAWKFRLEAVDTVQALTLITSVQLKVLENQLFRTHLMRIRKYIICKQLIERDFLKDVDAQNLQNAA